MTFGICPLSVVPLRSNAAHKSEQISQLLFGEMVEYLEKRGSWLKVRCVWDNYIGWVQAAQLEPITRKEYELYSARRSYNLDVVAGAMAGDHYIPLTLGASLPNFDGMRFSIGTRYYNFSGQTIDPLDVKPSADLILKIARRYLYAPYQWGGRSPMGIDCSGFVQVIFKMVGLSLPRDSSQQVEKGELIDFIEETQEGDLAFFDNRKGHINHVGILMPEGKIIHASGQVRVDKLDHYGIYNEELKKYTHRLRVVRRVLPKIDRSMQTSSEEKAAVSKRQVNLF
jgi:hypothetical protein